MKEKLIVALDVHSRDAALSLVRLLADHVGLFKVGMELFNSWGPAIVREIGGERIFLDLKFHDIPHTVAGAARAVSALGVKMFNVHATGGSEMMRAARDAAISVSAGNAPSPIVLGVTVLTSLNQKCVERELKVRES
ncbi:MAG: orotidine-5'-phosphate decarboxylase, partial [Armatimonadetes bacterium CG_4_9_14_3_um_filter_58_7]